MIQTDWECLTDRDFLRLSMGGWKKTGHKKEYLNHGQIFTTCEIGGYCENIDDLQKRIQSMFREERYGTVFRVKGYVRDLEKNWYEVNCSPDICNLAPCQRKRGLLVVIERVEKSISFQRRNEAENRIKRMIFSYSNIEYHRQE